MSWLDTALSDRVWHQEEVELSINHLRLLNKALINIGSLWWVVNESVTIVVGLLEEALAYTLVDDNQGHLWCWQLLLASFEVAVLLINDTVQLLKLEVYNLLSHAVTDTVTVDENVVWHFALVELSVALE